MNCWRIALLEINLRHASTLLLISISEFSQSGRCHIVIFSSSFCKETVLAPHPSSKSGFPQLYFACLYPPFPRVGPTSFPDLPRHWKLQPHKGSSHLEPWVVYWTCSPFLVSDKPSLICWTGEELISETAWFRGTFLWVSHIF